MISNIGNEIVDLCCHFKLDSFTIRKRGGVYEFFIIFNNSLNGFNNYKRNLISDNT